MESCVPRKPLQIVEDNDKTLVRLRIEKAEQRDHAGPLHEVAAASNRIREDSDDLMTFSSGVLTTPQFLTV
nr:hypothetical protein [Agrobacterium vitis]